MEAFLKSEADYTNVILASFAMNRKVDTVSEGRNTTQRLFNRNGKASREAFAI